MTEYDEKFDSTKWRDVVIANIDMINNKVLQRQEVAVRREKVAYSDRQPTTKSLTITANITILEDTQIKIIQPELTQRSK